MAKRYTDTDKWKKPLLRGLDAPYKLLWFYLLDDCDHAGIWQVDREVAELKIGFKIDWDTAVKCFQDKIQVFDGGNKWFIPGFIEFQYGLLNQTNRAHASVISLLNKYNLIDKNKPLLSPLEGAMDKDMDKDNKGGMGEKPIHERLKIYKNSLINQYAFFTPEFESLWKDFKEMRIKKKKPLTDRAIALNLNSIQKLSNGDPKLAIKICEQTIMRGWDGFFEIKEIEVIKNKGFVIGQKHNAAG